MSKWVKGLLYLVIFGSSLQACSPKFKDQPDCGFQKNVYGERVSWKDRIPIQLQVHSSFPAEYLPALENAIKTWEDSVGKKMFRITATNVGGAAEPRQDGTNLVYWLGTLENEKATEQARTTVYYVGNEIREADIRVNAKNHKYYLYDPPNETHLHLESLLLHELGHMLGLAHRADAGTVMATTLGGRTVRNKVSAKDQESLICEY